MSLGDDYLGDLDRAINSSLNSGTVGFLIRLDEIVILRGTRKQERHRTALPC